MSEKYENSIEDYKQLQVSILVDFFLKLEVNFFQESLPKRRVELDRKIAEINEKINNRNEAMKADVMEKLKGFGNFCLSPFGLSTDSFEMVPNGNGGFSVQMKGATNKQEGASQEKKEEENA